MYVNVVMIQREVRYKKRMINSSCHVRLVKSFKRIDARWIGAFGFPRSQV